MGAAGGGESAGPSGSSAPETSASRSSLGMVCRATGESRRSVGSVGPSGQPVSRPAGNKNPPPVHHEPPDRSPDIGRPRHLQRTSARGLSTWMVPNWDTLNQLLGSWHTAVFPLRGGGGGPSSFPIDQCTGGGTAATKGGAPPIFYLILSMQRP